MERKLRPHVWVAFSAPLLSGLTLIPVVTGQTSASAGFLGPVKDYPGWLLVFNNSPYVLLPTTPAGWFVLAILFCIVAVGGWGQLRSATWGCGWALVAGFVVVLGTAWGFTAWATMNHIHLHGWFPDLFYNQLLPGFWLLGMGLAGAVVLLLYVAVSDLLVKPL